MRTATTVSFTIPSKRVLPASQCCEAKSDLVRKILVHSRLRCDRPGRRRQSGLLVHVSFEVLVLASRGAHLPEGGVAQGALGIGHAVH